MRSTIYRFVVVDEEEVAVARDMWPTRTALLQTYSTIRGEAISIFYSENTFCVRLDGQSNATSFKWLNAFESKLTLMRNVVFEPGISTDYCHQLLDAVRRGNRDRYHDLVAKTCRIMAKAREKDSTEIRKDLGQACAAGLKAAGVISRPLPLRGNDASFAQSYWWSVVMFTTWHVNSMRQAAV